MSPSLLCSQIAISDLKHVKIVVAEEVAVLEEEDAVIDDGHFAKSVWTTNIATWGGRGGPMNGLLNPHE